MHFFNIFVKYVSRNPKTHLTKINNMSKNLTNAASAALGTSSYETPAINIVEVHSEGVLCSSLTDDSEGSFNQLIDGGDIF